MLLKLLYLTHYPRYDGSSPPSTFSNNCDLHPSMPTYYRNVGSITVVTGQENAVLATANSFRTCCVVHLLCPVKFPKFSLDKITSLLPIVWLGSGARLSNTSPEMRRTCATVQHVNSARHETVRLNPICYHLVTFTGTRARANNPLKTWNRSPGSSIAFGSFVAETLHLI